MKIETDSSFYGSEKGFIRSSALKPFENCSYLYYADYFLGIPKSGNKGSQMGQVCHTFLECIIEEKRKSIHKIITNAGTICAYPAAEKLVRKLIPKNGLIISPEIFKQIDDMILVGLKTDFYIKGGKIIGKEYRFKIKNESPKYSIYGTMDKVALKGKNVIVQDYKSSKLKYSGDDFEVNAQALIYSLACKKLYPDYEPIIRFIFLQYPDQPIQELKFTNEELKGFEHYLESMQLKMSNFSEKDSWSHFAADEGFPKTGEFKGRLLCGYASKPGQLKKNGEIMFACEAKFAFNYYVLIKDNKIIQKSKNKSDLIANEGETIETRHFDGCPRFKNALNDLPDTKINKSNNINTSSILDDL